MVIEEERKLFVTSPVRSVEADMQNPIDPVRRRFCQYLVAGSTLAAGAYFASQIPKVEAVTLQRPEIDVYRATSTPLIDGQYDMTLTEANIGGEEKFVDEWNDATWIEVPKRTGNMKTYSGYKFDDHFLYAAYVIPLFSYSDIDSHEPSVDTCFDPKNNPGSAQANTDDFVIGATWVKEKKGPSPWIRYGQSDGKYGAKQPMPDVVVSSALSSSPFSSDPSLFFELKIPLTIGGLSDCIGSKIGLCTETYVPNLADNNYPTMPEYSDFITANYAIANFVKDKNPNITNPPTVVPEFPLPALILGGVILGSAVLMSRRKWLKAPWCASRGLS